MFIGIAVIYFIIQYTKYSRLVNLLLIGLIVGIGTYLRPNVVYLAVFSSIFAIFYLGKKRAMRLVLISSIVVIFLLLPWWVRNYRIYHRFIPLSANFGVAFWGGLGIVSNPYGFEYSDEAADRYVREMGYTYGYGPEFSNVLLERALEVIKTHPVFYLETIVHRIPKALFPNIPWGIEPKDFDFVPNWSFHSWQEVTGGGLINYAKNYPFIFGYKLMRKGMIIVLFILALSGFWLRRKEWAKGLLLISVPLYFILIHSTLSYPNSRYTLAGTWVYIVFAAVGIEYLLERGKHFGQRFKNYCL
jgi:4-amino-4-deoxy-L-arabinose transferase-like glycosyltransferase